MSIEELQREIPNNTGVELAIIGLYQGQPISVCIDFDSMYLSVEFQKDSPVSPDQLLHYLYLQTVAAQ